MKKEKAKEILSAWKNVIIPDEEIEKVAAERLKICNECEFKDVFMLMDVCSVCLCPLVAKTRSKEGGCPKGKW